MNPDSHNRLNMWINAFPRVAGAIAIVTGTTVIVGWIFEIEILKSLHPSMVSMKANAALAFVLAGTSLLLLHSSAKSMQMKRVAQSLAMVIIVIGSLTLIEYTFGWNTGIDQLLFRDSAGVAGALHEGRMPFSAAVSFVFFGTAILVLEVRTRRGNVLSQILAIGVGLMGSLGVLGYIYNLPEFVGYAVHTRMAAPGAMTFIVLSIGVLALRPDDGIIGEIKDEGVGGFMARRLLPAAIGMPIVIGWLTEEGESLRLYGNQFGEVIAATAYIALALAVVWRTARSLNKLDAKRKRAEAALAWEEYLLNALLQNIPDHIYFKDTESRFLRISRTLAEVFGLSDPAQAVGKTDFAFFTEEHARLANQDEREIMRTGRPLSKEERETWRDRSDTWVLTTKMPLRDKAGEIIGTFGISRDVTERRRAEQERESLIEELKTALENVRTLDGLVPICAHCKKIRDDKGYWNQLEKYILDHTDAKLSHGLCPDCAQLYFPGIAANTSPGGS